MISERPRSFWSINITSSWDESLSLVLTMMSHYILRWCQSQIINVLCYMWWSDMTHKTTLDQLLNHVRYPRPSQALGLFVPSPDHLSSWRVDNQHFEVLSQVCQQMFLLLKSETFIWRVLVVTIRSPSEKQYKSTSNTIGYSLVVPASTVLEMSALGAGCPQRYASQNRY